jgi:hypothetical protein
LAWTKRAGGDRPGERETAGQHAQALSHLALLMAARQLVDESHDGKPDD